MVSKLNLPKDKDLATKVLDVHAEAAKRKDDLGILGSLWGNSSSVPNNVAGLLIVSLVLTGIIFTFCAINLPVQDVGISIKDFWATIVPLITLSIGYLFGDKGISKNKD